MMSGVHQPTRNTPGCGGQPTVVDMTILGLKVPNMCKFICSMVDEMKVNDDE